MRSKLFLLSFFLCTAAAVTGAGAAAFAADVAGEQAVSAETEPVPPPGAASGGGEYWRERVNEDGSRTREFATAPVFFLNEKDRWEPIDLTLQPASDGGEFRARRGPARIARPVTELRTGEPTLRLSTPAGELQAAHPDIDRAGSGARGQGTGLERRVTYGGAMSGCTRPDHRRHG